jgi:hypothetical protein
MSNQDQTISIRVSELKLLLEIIQQFENVCEEAVIGVESIAEIDLLAEKVGVTMDWSISPED